VVAQAPEHVIERVERRAGGGKKVKSTHKGPAKGEVSWSAETFERLISRVPETLRSRFRVTHAMVIHLLQRDAELDDPSQRNFASLRELIAHSHEDEGPRLHLRFAAVCAVVRPRWHPEASGHARLLLGVLAPDLSSTSRSCTRFRSSWSTRSSGSSRSRRATRSIC
jgi:hypothetical protein